MGPLGIDVLTYHLGMLLTTIDSPHFRYSSDAEIVVIQ